MLEWAGDIVGIPNHGALHIGDTLSESEALRFPGVPRFAPDAKAWGHPNLDLQLHLHRAPSAGWLGLDDVVVGTRGDSRIESVRFVTEQPGRRGRQQLVGVA